MNKPNQSQPNSKNPVFPHIGLTPGLTETMLYNIGNIMLKWSEAAGPFLSIEPLMRFFAEQHIPYREKVVDLIKSAKKKPQFPNYWDCDPTYLTDAVKALYGKNMSADELDKISKFPAMRGKFLHGNFIELMEIMGIDPLSPRMSQHMGQFKKDRLKDGEIYDSFLSMDNNRVFESLRQYSEGVRTTLMNIIRGLVK